MPYKDPERRRAAGLAHYHRNKHRYAIKRLLRRDDPEKLAHERRVARDAARRRRAADPERAKAERRERFEATREKSMEQMRAWREANPEKHLATARKHSARRRALKAGALDGYGSVDPFDYLAARDGGDCRVCGALAEHVDHIIPLAAGGNHTPLNTWLLCAPCNDSKRDRNLAVWLEDRERRALPVLPSAWAPAVSDMVAA